MTVKNFIGYAILLSFFMALFCFVGSVAGFVNTALCFGSVIIIMWLLALAIVYIYD